MSTDERAEFVAGVEAHANDLALSIDDPKALIRNLAEWCRKNYPERVASALWIRADGSRDKGISVRIYEKPIGKLEKWRLRLSALLGEETGGPVVTIPFRTPMGYEIGLGIGASVSYADFRDVSAVAAFTLRF